MASASPGEYEPRINAQESLPRRVMPRAPDISNNGLQAVGSGIASVGDAVQKVQQQDAAVFNSNAMATARTDWTQEMLNRQQSYKNGDDLTGTVAKDFNAYKAKIVAAAPKMAQRTLDTQMTMLGANLTQNAMQYQAKAQVEGRINTWNEGAEKAKIHVATNPDDFEDSYREQLNGLNALQVDQSTKNKYADRLKSDLSINAAEGYVKRDPEGVLKLLTKEQTGNAALDRLTVEQRGQIENFANAEIRQRDAEKRQKSNELAADTKARITDLSASYRAGLPVDPKQELSPSQLEAAFPKQGMDLWKDLQKDKRLGLDMKDMAHMTPAELADTVKKYEVTQGGKDAADALARHGEILQSAQQSIAARQKDPRAFAVQNGIDSKPIDFDNPAGVLSELQSRAANASRTSTSLGVAAPLLSREETKQFATLLDKSTPNQKASWLGTLATKLGSGPYQALMGQVLPNNPVSAIVGAQIGHLNAQQPAQWFDHQFAGDPTGPEKILEGEKLLNSKEEKVKFPMPPDHTNAGIGTRDFFAQKTGDLFRDRPQLGEATYAAFRSAYAGLLAEKGDFKGDGDRALQKKALDIAVGEIQNFNGHSVAIPQGMDPGKFKGFVKEAVLTTARAYGAPKDFEDRIDGYQLRELGSVGSGRYQLVQGNAPLVRPDGKGFFTIDLRQQYGEK